MSSDVTTALIQAVGGGLSISHNQAPRQWGSHVCLFATPLHISEVGFEKIFLAGLVLQLVSFTLFSGIYVCFLYRVYTLERGVWERDKAEPWYRDWRTLAVTLAISCIGILIRSGYRVAELSQGFQGYLATTEAFFYALDTLPLVIATSVYVFCWPAWFIKDGTKTVHVEPELSNSP
ncbi:RTA-like protein [Boletus reticuloceps]|uniref:RTA-like protein n=1 Tax=Boletus reticuloceps TaxID=495285 RepID=A0A8I2YXU5_9AGAM|nr:RTA-like protein [Boletus reticuloceps]